MKLAYLNILFFYCLTGFSQKQKLTYISVEKVQLCMINKNGELYNCSNKFYDTPILFEISEKVIFSKNRNSTNSCFINSKVIDNQIITYKFTNDKGIDGVFMIDLDRKEMLKFDYEFEPAFAHIYPIKNIWEK